MMISSFGAWIELNAEITPKGREVSSISPTETRDGHFTRSAKYAASKYPAVVATLAGSRSRGPQLESQYGQPKARVGFAFGP